MIPYGRQHVDDGDVDAVAEVLRSDWLTQGPTVERFEQALAEHVGAQHAVAFSSGTAALHGAAHVAGLGPGDLVATSPLTFIASANCARYVGATPYLVDVEQTTWNLDLAAVPDGAAATVPVHYAGLPVDLAAWTRPTEVVIEDAAHALGATTPDGPVGNCARSDMTCFSFHPVKPITTAEGGMVTTNDADLAERLRRFRSHGTERRPSEGGWAYAAVELGFNYRLSDVHAALGLHQLPKLERFIVRRNEIAAHYRDRLSGLVGLPPAAPGGFRHGYHLFPVLVPERRRVYDELRGKGVAVQVHYVPVHHHPVAASDPRPSAGLPTCEAIYEQVLSLPVYPDLTDDQVDEVVRALEAVV
jgi:dTDP-4-amino-4,6-dideoxygalactose transaminase